MGHPQKEAEDGESHHPSADQQGECREALAEMRRFEDRPQQLVQPDQHGAHADGGELIAYPFQQHFGQLSDTAIVEACRESPGDLIAAAAAGDFESWIGARFGEGVARHFMLPYNRKIWARDLKRMSCEWVRERIAGAEAPSQEARP